MKLFILTLKAPRRNNVGCNPTENINRRIVEAIKARMPWGLGRAMTMAREMSMAVHSSPDQCGSSVPGKTRQGSQRSVLSPSKRCWTKRHFLQSSNWPYCPNSHLQFCAPDVTSHIHVFSPPSPDPCSYYLGNSFPFPLHPRF